MKVVLELPGNEATALSASVASASLEAGLLHRVAFDLPARGFSIIHHRERHLSEATRAFFRLLGID